jgi:hypothetical protein
VKVKPGQPADAGLLARPLRSLPDSTMVLARIEHVLREGHQRGQMAQHGGEPPG